MLTNALALNITALHTPLVTILLEVLYARAVMAIGETNSCVMVRVNISTDES